MSAHHVGFLYGQPKNPEMTCVRTLDQDVQVQEKKMRNPLPEKKQLAKQSVQLLSAIKSINAIKV